MDPDSSERLAENFVEVINKCKTFGIRVTEETDLIAPEYVVIRLRSVSKLALDLRIKRYCLTINNHPDLLHTIAEIEKFIDTVMHETIELKPYVDPLEGMSKIVTGLSGKVFEAPRPDCIYLKGKDDKVIPVHPEFVEIWEGICNNVDKELKSRGEFVIDYAKLTDVLIQLGIALPKDEEN